MAIEDTVCIGMGSDRAEDVWDESTRVEELENAVGIWTILLILIVVCGCSDVRPYIRSDNLRLDKAERIEVGIKGKF